MSGRALIALLGAGGIAVVVAAFWLLGEVRRPVASMAMEPPPGAARAADTARSAPSTAAAPPATPPPAPSPPAAPAGAGAVGAARPPAAGAIAAEIDRDELQRTAETMGPLPSQLQAKIEYELRDAARTAQADLQRGRPVDEIVQSIEAAKQRATQMAVSTASGYMPVIGAAFDRLEGQVRAAASP